ncbi:hypothetical protein KIPB_009221, partial [Kipferlia bialata]|eukprot:g9221.t1
MPNLCYTGCNTNVELALLKRAALMPTPVPDTDMGEGEGDTALYNTRVEEDEGEGERERWEQEVMHAQPPHADGEGEGEGERVRRERETDSREREDGEGSDLDLAEREAGDAIERAMSRGDVPMRQREREREREREGDLDDEGHDMDNTLMSSVILSGELSHVSKVAMSVFGTVDKVTARSVNMGHRLPNGTRTAPPSNIDQVLRKVRAGAGATSARGGQTVVGRYSGLFYGSGDQRGREGEREGEEAWEQEEQMERERERALVSQIPSVTRYETWGQHGSMFLSSDNDPLSSSALSATSNLRTHGGMAPTPPRGSMGSPRRAQLPLALSDTLGQSLHALRTRRGGMGGTGTGSGVVAPVIPRLDLSLSHTLPLSLSASLASARHSGKTPRTKSRSARRPPMRRLDTPAGAAKGGRIHGLSQSARGPGSARGRVPSGTRGASGSQSHRTQRPSARDTAKRGNAATSARMYREKREKLEKTPRSHPSIRDCLDRYTACHETDRMRGNQILGMKIQGMAQDQTGGQYRISREERDAVFYRLSARGKTQTDRAEAMEGADVEAMITDTQAPTAQAPSEAEQREALNSSRRVGGGFTVPLQPSMPPPPSRRPQRVVRPQIHVKPAGVGAVGERRVRMGTQSYKGSGIAQMLIH